MPRAMWRSVSRATIINTVLALAVLTVVGLSVRAVTAGDQTSNTAQTTTTVDTGKYANFVAGSHCANCQLYQGGDEWGGCGIFPGQQVAAGGWCSAYAKKAG